MQKHGCTALWRDLPTPEFMRVIGRGSQKCSRAMHLVGALHDGKLIGYSSPVLDEDPASPETANVPPLHGLAQFVGTCSWFDNRIWKLRCVLEGARLGAPLGTKTHQCEQAISNHWLLGVGHWDEASPAEIDRVQRFRSAPPVV